MATYQITGPKGEIYQIDGPDNSDPSAVISQLTGQKHKPQSMDVLADGTSAPTGSPAAKAALSPVSDSGVENFLAGAGKATVDIGRGLGQMAGLESREGVANSRTLDAPLMKTTAGKAGFITGTAADMLPSAFIPGAGTLGGAAAIGAGSGLAQPSTSTRETLRNTAVGGVMAPAAILAGRGLGALYQGGKAAIEPLFRGGQQRVAARTLQSFAGGDQASTAAANAIQNAPAVLPGVQSTTAELANNGGIAQLERSLRNNPEYLNALTERNQSNRAAMTGALDQMAGTPAQMQGAVAARSATAAPLYDAASQAVVPADAELGRLLARPSMARAWERAQSLASEQGISLREPAANEISGQTLQYLKMGLNDLVGGGPQTGMGAHELNAVRGTLRALNYWTTNNVPQLRAADRAFSQGSVPINQMEVAGELRNRLVPALGDFGNNTRLSAQNFANAVRNGDQLAAHSTGMPNATLEGVLHPDQMRAVTQIGEQLARRSNADELGRAVGSNTGQNLVSQNVLRQFLGPLGLPQSMGERAAQSTLSQTVLRPLQFVARGGEDRVMAQLARAAMDPQYARTLLLTQPNSPAARILWSRQGLLGSLSQPVQQGLLGPNPAQ